jgi:hypothetical protein
MGAAGRLGAHDPIADSARRAAGKTGRVINASNDRWVIATFATESERIDGYDRRDLLR